MANTHTHHNPAGRRKALVRPCTHVLPPRTHRANTAHTHWKESFRLRSGGQIIKYGRRSIHTWRAALAHGARATWDFSLRPSHNMLRQANKLIRINPTTNRYSAF